VVRRRWSVHQATWSALIIATFPRRSTLRQQGAEIHETLDVSGGRLMSSFTCRALDESTWPAFAALVERNGGIFGGCWCMGFHPEGVGKDSTVALNHERKLNRVRAGTAHAALAFDQGTDECVGWCQFGEPAEVPRIKSRAAYERTRPEPPDWRIACWYVGKGHRRGGVATAALAGALDLIAQLGGGTVEGYPEDAASVPAGFLFNGALSTYERLGFVRSRMIGKHRWVVTRVVEPGSALREAPKPADARGPGHVPASEWESGARD
jgi:GNAT superfamily N-acetyltransferase